jgi:pyruvate dehydrogenase E2 component (dihydrolipoamide acetyltransferase)
MSFRYPVVMPKMSMTMETGELILYHVKVGDRVTNGQVLFEVMTDKIDMEVESPADGVIEQLIGEIGVAIEIGKPVLIMQTDTEVMSFDIGADAPLIPEPTPEAPIAVAPIAVAPIAVNQIKAVPKARSIAEDRGIDLRSIIATGPDNTIMLADVGGARPSDDQLKRQIANRALIARGLEMTRLIPQASFSRRNKNPVTDSAHLISTWAKVLRARPELNLNAKEGTPLSHIGVAMIIESKYGSALPVFKDPDFFALSDLSDLVSATSTAAQQGKVPLAMLSGATTTIFDLTAYKMNSQTPLLFPNQLTSLTVGVDKKDSQIISLTIDLRYCDFYDGAQLLDHLITSL